MPAPQHKNILARPRGSLLARAAGAAAVSRARRGRRGPLEIEDAATAAVFRAATSPLDTTDGGALIAEESAGFIAGLAPQSAAAALFARALRLDLAKTSVPALDGASAAWIEELDAIPVTAMTSTGPALEPRKLASIVALSVEVMKRSDAERLVADAINRKAARALDLALFGDDEGTDAQPAGLLYGLTPLAAGADGLIAGLSALADAVGEYGTPVFIASAGAKVAIDAVAPSVPVLASHAVAPGTIVAVAPEALAYATGGADISASIESSIHMADEPTAISTPGEPATVAAPVRSMFQTACVATRLIVDVGWMLRAAGAVAYTEITGGEE
jgi:hypothetical protein